MPSLLLTNANRLLNKIDDLSLLVQSHAPDLIAITETWLDAGVPDAGVSLQHYSIVRRDRKLQQGGGVALYVNNNLSFHAFDMIVDNVSEFEILWVSIRPRLLPRQISILIVAIIYCPPSYNVASQNELSRLILNCTDKLKQRYPNSGFILCGDFNQLNTSNFNHHLCFKQVISFPTRGFNMLDKIFMNCSQFYSAPVCLSPLGRSDHCCVFMSSTGVRTKCATNKQYCAS